MYSQSDPRYVNVSPCDVKGGFPIQFPFSQSYFLYISSCQPSSDDRHISQNFTEMDCYAESSHSKTIVSPSFCEAAGREVTTTGVWQNNTTAIVTVMSRMNVNIRPDGSSLLTPVPSFDTMTCTFDDVHGISEKDVKLEDFGQHQVSIATKNYSANESDLNGSTHQSSANYFMPNTSFDTNTILTSIHGNTSIENNGNFEQFMETKKQKIRAAEEELMQVGNRTLYLIHVWIVLVQVYCRQTDKCFY